MLVERDYNWLEKLTEEFERKYEIAEFDKEVCSIAPYPDNTIEIVSGTGIFTGKVLKHFKTSDDAILSFKSYIETFLHNRKWKLMWRVKPGLNYVAEVKNERCIDCDGLGCGGCNHKGKYSDHEKYNVYSRLIIERKE